MMYAGPVAGWRSLAARRPHKPQVAGSNPAPATIACRLAWALLLVFLVPACDGSEATYDVGGGLEKAGAALSLPALAFAGTALKKLSQPSRSAGDVAALVDTCRRQQREIDRLAAEVSELRSAAITAGLTALVRQGGTT